jgi:hypothetical protein
MEQVQGGDLIVNKGNEAKLKDVATDRRNMNLVEGLESAVKLAKASMFQNSGVERLKEKSRCQLKI